MANRAEENGVEGTELLEPVLGHHALGVKVVFAAPRQLGERKRDGRPARYQLGAGSSDVA